VAGRIALLLLAAIALPGATSAAARPAPAEAVVRQPPDHQLSPVATVPEDGDTPALLIPSQTTAEPSLAHSALEGNQVIAIYGHPGVPIMGILGAMSPDQAAREVKRLATEWDVANGTATSALGALHLITYVAQPYPMEDGSYLMRLPAERIEEYADAAARHGLLLFLDVQVGMADPVTEAQRLEAFLSLPYVHLALDPEFAMRKRGGRPGQRIGSLDGSEVNAVQRYLAGLVRTHTLPPKMLILHQFRDDMLTNTAAYENLAEVERIVDMDGWGGTGVKLAHYEAFALASYAERPGIKLFYEWDTPVLRIEQLLALPQVPAVVIYQ
jgi:hypothetical protein